jgi:hypothetical protein
MASPLSEYLTVLGLGIQIGSSVFFTFILTPVLFANLTRQEAAQAVRLGSPGYHGTGSSGLALALGASLLGGAGPWLAPVLAVALGIGLYSRFAVLPRLLRAGSAILQPETPDPDDPAQQELDRLHELSVRLDVTRLALALFALWLAVR